MWPFASVASAHHPLARLRPHDGGLAGLLKRPGSSSRYPSIGMALCASMPCIGTRPFPSGRPARYGIVRPTDYSHSLERSLIIQSLLLRQHGLALRRPFLPPDSIPPSMASAFVFSSASMHSQFRFSSSLANRSGPGDSSGGRILRRHCGDIVSPPSSSNILDKTTHHHASSIQHWNVYSGSAGLEALLLRLCLLSGGFS
jgi:hypothetical protein